MLRVDISFGKLTFPPPPGEEWIYIVPDFQLPTWHEFYPIRGAAVALGGAPGVAVINDDSIEIDKPKQEFIANLMSLCRFDKVWTPITGPALNGLRFFNSARKLALKAIYNINRAIELITENDLTVEERDLIEKCYTGTMGTTVAYANGQGYPGRANWITLEDLDKENPKYDKMRTMITNTHKGSKTKNNKGEDVYELEAFRIDQPLPVFTSRADLYDHRIVWSTIIRNNKLTNNPETYSVNKFPRLDGADVPMPLFWDPTKNPLQIAWYWCEAYTGERRPIRWPPTGTPWAA